jgi:hypothetical protein
LFCGAISDPGNSTYTVVLPLSKGRTLQEVSSVKVSADKMVKEAKARAIKAKKSLAEVSQRQASHEEAIVK